jgi:predicted nucleic acid-binding protein
MSDVQLIADTNVVSYAFRGGPLGRAYVELMGDRVIGVTGMCLAEMRAGAILGRWDERKTDELIHFVRQFTHVLELEGVAEVCGALRGVREQIGRPIDLPDAWAAACALWLDIPLVTHDRDLEGIPDLRVLTLHDNWRVGEESLCPDGSTGLWIGSTPRVLC